MTSPTRTSATRPGGAARPTRVTGEPHGLSAAPARLKIALGLALVAAAAAAAAVPLGVLRAAPPAGFGSEPMLLVLALLPVVLAVGLVLADRAVIGARVLVGSALLAPGALLVDLQVLLDSTTVARPELVMPTSLAKLSPDLGGWLLVAAHVVVIVAGVAAAGLAGAVPGGDYAERVENQERSLVSARRMLGLSLGCGVLIAIGVLMPALYSHDALLVSVDVVPNPWLVRAGGLLAGLVAPVALAWSAGTGNPDVHRGVSLGVLTAIAAVSVPPIVAGLLMDRVGVAPGPVVALVGAVLAVGVSWAPVRADDTEDSGVPEREVELTLRANRLHQAAGLLGVVLGVASAISAFGTVFTVSPLGGIAAPTVIGEPTRLALAAGLLVAVLGLLVAVTGSVGAVARPAFVVALGGLALPATAALDAALGATKVRDSLQAQSVPGAGEQVGFGAGFWLSIAVLLGAALAAVAAGLAGGAERDELDLTDRPDNQILWAPAAMAALAAIGAFGLPVLRAPGYRAPGIWSDFELASAGQLLALLAVLVAVLIAPQARPARAVALLLGAAAVLGVHLLEVPLGSSRIPGATAGPGWWLSLVTIGLLLVGAVVAGTARSTPAPRSIQRDLDDAPPEDETSDPEPSERVTRGTPEAAARRRERAAARRAAREGR